MFLKDPVWGAADLREPSQGSSKQGQSNKYRIRMLISALQSSIAPVG
jgi:hypothetical protein